MKKTRFIITIVSLILVFSALVTSSVGWYSSLKAVKPQLGFSAGGTGDFQIFRITYADDAESTQKSEAVSSVGTAFDITKLQFGKINNLSYLVNSNYIYYAVRIPKSMGNTVNLGISHGQSTAQDLHFDIYVPIKAANGDYITDANGNITTELYTDSQNLPLIAAIETDNDSSFISYSFAISEKEPSELSLIADMNTLFEGKTPSKLAALDSGGNPTQVSELFDTQALSGNYYYVYIKLQPNITLYKYFIDYLWANMPFCLAYDIRVYLTVVAGN